MKTITNSKPATQTALYSIGLALEKCEQAQELNRLAGNFSNTGALGEAVTSLRQLQVKLNREVNPVSPAQVFNATRKALPQINL